MLEWGDTNVILFFRFDVTPKGFGVVLVQSGLNYIIDVIPFCISKRLFTCFLAVAKSAPFVGFACLSVKSSFFPNKSQEGPIKPR